MVEILLDRSVHCAGHVLWMTAGEHHLVPGQQVAPLVVQVFIGQHVVGEAAGFEPADQGQVGGEVARCVLQAPGSIFWPHVQDWPQARRVGATAAIAVHVIQR